MTPDERIAFRRVMTILHATIDGPRVERCPRGSRITAAGKVHYAHASVPVSTQDYVDAVRAGLVPERRRRGERRSS
jgi:hypothetical protein